MQLKVYHDTRLWPEIELSDMLCGPVNRFFMFINGRAIFIVVVPLPVISERGPGSWFYK